MAAVHNQGISIGQKLNARKTSRIQLGRCWMLEYYIKLTWAPGVAGHWEVPVIHIIYWAQYISRRKICSYLVIEEGYFPVIGMSNWQQVVYPMHIVLIKQLLIRFSALLVGGGVTPTVWSMIQNSWKVGTDKTIWSLRGS